MASLLNRTPEWTRLSSAGAFRAKDEPGSITLSAGLPAMPLRFWLAVFVYLPVALFAVLDMAQEGGLAGAVALAAGAATLWSLGYYWPLFGPFAYKVAFTPDGLELFGLGGRSLGFMPREAMQQIAVEQDEARKRAFICHHFYSDIGTVRGFPIRNRAKALLRNNMLMAAFQQPLHLDLIADAQDPFQYAPAPMLNLTRDVLDRR